jgi:hypothetical protein
MKPTTPAMQQLATTGALGLLGAAAALGMFASACSPAAPRLYAQNATIRVESDPGVPLAGVPLVSDGKTVTFTTREGLAQVRMTGRDGDLFHVAIVCPEGFIPASAVEFDVLVRRGENAAHVPEFGARCARAVRRAVVAVRTTNGANLPVVHLGRQVGKTDASGAATVALDVRPGADVELVIDTRAAKKIHPQNPVLSFKAKDQDDFVVLDQSFTVDKAAVARFAPRAPKVPTALGGGE